MTRQHIVFLTGAGINAESGLSTFRGKDGLWTKEEFQYLASTDCLYEHTQKCLDFYNMLRKQLAEVEPNEAHRLIAELEKEHEVTIITQNVDNLHERAGSSHVIHIHGELTKVCSMNNRTTCVKEYPLTTPIIVGDKAEDGAQLRPYIVMFGEYVDSMNVAVDYVSNADIFVVIVLLCKSILLLALSTMHTILSQSSLSILAKWSNASNLDSPISRQQPQKA